MAVRKILQYPEYKTALRKKSKQVTTVNKRVKTMIMDLKDTLEAHSDGVGLAAPQLNIHIRIVIVRLGTTKPDKEWEPGPSVALVNPEIIAAREFRKDFDGCLSFPGLYGETIRPHYLQVTGFDEHGRPLNQTFKNFNAVLVHHEIDHLEGVLFIDRVQGIEDLYRIKHDQNGDMMRVPISLQPML